MTTDELVNVRYTVDDVQAAIDFYTTRLGFTLSGSASAAFAAVTRGSLRLGEPIARSAIPALYRLRPSCRT